MNTTTQNLKRHDLSAFFYDMPKNDFQSLKESISKHGVLNPIVIFDEKVLDGWHRYKACQELSLSCPFVDFNEHYPEINVKDFVIAQNKERKSLTQSQIALAVTQVAQWMPVGVKKKDLEEDTSQGRTLTEKEIADKSGTSVRTIQRAKQVIRDGSDELKEAVKEGKMGVKKAAEIAKLPKEAQKEAINKPLPKKELTDEAIAAGLTENPYELIARLEKETIELNEQIISLSETDHGKEIIRLQGLLKMTEERARDFQREAHELSRQVKSNSKKFRELNQFYLDMAKATDRKDYDEIVSYVKNLRAKFQ